MKIGWQILSVILYTVLVLCLAKDFRTVRYRLPWEKRRLSIRDRERLRKEQEILNMEPDFDFNLSKEEYKEFLEFATTHTRIEMGMENVPEIRVPAKNNGLELGYVYTRHEGQEDEEIVLILGRSIPARSSKGSDLSH